MAIDLIGALPISSGSLRKRTKTAAMEYFRAEVMMHNLATWASILFAAIDPSTWHRRLGIERYLGRRHLASGS